MMNDVIIEKATTIVAAGLDSILSSAADNVIKKYKNANDWKKLLVETGNFFAENEADETTFFADLSTVLSKENMSLIAKKLEKEDGYELKEKLYNLIMQFMNKYEIPYEIAESYTTKIIVVIFEQLKQIDPDKYEHYYIRETHEEIVTYLHEISKRVEIIERELKEYSRNCVNILTSGQMDINLRKCTKSPSIGIDFFRVDDEQFQEKFETWRKEEMFYVRGRCIEETVYCILNELRRLNDTRPVYVVRDLESWNRLCGMHKEENIYIPFFYADEIVPIENNTNIFVVNDTIPLFNGMVLGLRPRTRKTISECLQEAGMDSQDAYNLVADTNGLYIPIKRKLFYGEMNKTPDWVLGISEKVKKVCLLLGKWEETEGDKLIIETLYGGKYEAFIEEINPYLKGDEPFLYVRKGYGNNTYYLASTDISWGYIGIDQHEPIWNTFIDLVLEVLSESEKMFTYERKDKLLAQFRGEKLFWSKTIRKGMLQTLIIKSAVKNENDYICYKNIVNMVLNSVHTEKQWSYISSFWSELCEISPEAVLDRMEKELCDSTGLLDLFANQSDDFFFGKNNYINILWGVEQFLTQREYFWQAFRWLLKLDAKNYEYKSNSTKDIFAKVFCIWRNYSAVQNPEEKLQAVQLAMESDRKNAWNYICESIGYRWTIVGELSTPKYREREIPCNTVKEEFQEVYKGYFEILLRTMDFSCERWEKMINLSEDLTIEQRRKVAEQLLYEIKHMQDYEVMVIKNHIREIVYKHRYFASADWAMNEENVLFYEDLLDSICTTKPEYEYAYLFKGGVDFPLLYPVSFETEGEREANTEKTEELIREKIMEFQKQGYRISILAKVCAKEITNTLGYYLAKYWDDGNWNAELFKELYEVQETGKIAIDYINYSLNDKVALFPDVINCLLKDGTTKELLSKIYRVEATKTRKIPLVDEADEETKKLFWGSFIMIQEENYGWALNESKRYANLEVFLEQVYMIHSRKKLNAMEIYDSFRNIEKMQCLYPNQMTGYYIEQLLGVLQNAFIEDKERCFRIAQIEIYYSNILEWNHMRCFHYLIKKSPELLAQIISVIFKRDHITDDKSELNETLIHNMYVIYDKAHFCPTEEQGIVSDELLKNWIEEFKSLLIENDQESLLTPILGRLFSFSPSGIDGHKPCEAVRNMIEEYGDEKLRERYAMEVYNSRGVYSSSAGKEELIMAEKYKENADYLAPYYPKTAEIYYELSGTYKRLSQKERKDAEDGWY